MKKMMLRKSIIVMLVSTILFGVILLFTFFITKPMINGAQEDKLLIQRDLLVKEIENQFIKIETSIMDLENYIDTSDNRDNLLDYMISIDDDSDMISSVYLGLTDNTMINSSGFVLPPDFDLTTRSWYQKAIETDGIIYTEAFLNASGDQVIITLANAVYDDTDQLLGVLGLDVNIQSISSLDDFQLDSEGVYGFLLDNQNNVIAHPDLDHDHLLLINAEDYEIPIDEFCDMCGVTEELSVNSERGYLSYKHIESSGYTLVLFMPSDVFNQTNTLLKFGMIIFLIIMVILSISLFALLNVYVLMPLNHLIEDINQIDISKRPNFRLNDSKKYGFKKARLALNQLIDTSVETQSMLKETNKELGLSFQKLDLLLMSAPDIVFQLNKELVYEEIFGKMFEIFGLSQEDFINKHFSDIFDDENDHIRQAYYNKVLKGSLESYTWMFDSQGKTLYLETSLSPIYGDDEGVIGIVGVTRDITRQEKQYQNLVYVSSHDYLTGLYNRRVSVETIDDLNKAKAYPYTLMNLDVNGLKLINDAFGHEIGDLLLVETAKVLSSQLREEDIASRVGGDEFEVILPGCDDTCARGIKKQLVKAFSQVTIKNYKLSIAIGYSVQYDDSKSVDELKKLAENDMYRHKILENRSVKNRTISAILKTLNDKHEIEKKHSKRVAKLSYELGLAIGLDDSDLEVLKTAALFHDIGKISIPDNILNKPSKLTKEEYEIIKSHTTIGYDILSAADEYTDLAIYASSHHERFDGKGYPKGLSGKDIPFFSRIICIADAYEAMTSDRPYRKKLSKKKAGQEILDYAGTQFDPELAKTFVEKVVYKK